MGHEITNKDIAPAADPDSYVIKGRLFQGVQYENGVKRYEVVPLYYGEPAEQIKSYNVKLSYSEEEIKQALQQQKDLKPQLRLPRGCVVGDEFVKNLTDTLNSVINNRTNEVLDNPEQYISCGDYYAPVTDAIIGYDISGDAKLKESLDEIAKNCKLPAKPDGYELRPRIDASVALGESPYSTLNAVDIIVTYGNNKDGLVNEGARMAKLDMTAGQIVMADQALQGVRTARIQALQVRTPQKEVVDISTRTQQEAVPMRR